jgi:DNA-binding CsgD family transcriptional regulator
MNDVQLTDQIYEAAVIPELWSTVCDRLAETVNSFSGSIITLDQTQTYRWISSPRIQPAMEEFSKSPLRFENVRPRKHLERAPFSFLRDIDVMTEDELADDPIYNAFMRPIGLGWTMGDVFVEPSGHTVIFDIIRQTDRGPFSTEDIATLNALKPDLSRAALMASRLAFRQANTVTEAMSSVGLPAAVLSDSGTVLAMNDEMERVEPRIRTGMRNRVSIDQKNADLILQATIDDIRAGRTPAIQSIPVMAADMTPAIILHVLPVIRAARDIFARSAAILVATPVGEVGPPDLRVISGLFDLTASEAKVAREIAVGTSVDEIAVKFNISRETVRTYLKQIFSKTGTSRQAQLTALLSGLGAKRT